ncbi:klebicin B immunity [Klebsiella quasipneumoniae]|uniref:Klebicin B immunity n=2 Tax=Klebsiella quasipneumoniae TaxID=1463165 RepID=A0ABD7N9I9_9ENTR|nr:klebicin B immunity [Klebsiella quasipneumoniae]SSG48983.1 klebicin B immunity [Klebsiella quasipneumoniae]
MDNKKSISDYTESEFLAFVEKIFKPDNTTEDEDVQNVLEFERITEHPNGALLNKSNFC